MFPSYINENPKDYFSIQEPEIIPVYRNMEVDEAKTVCFANAVRTLGENCYGYFDNCKINFQICDNECCDYDSYPVIMNNKYVFAYFKDIEFDNNLPVTLIFEFIKYGADKLLLIFEDTHLLIEKTPDTFKACEKLEEIFLSDSFLFNVIISSIYYGNRDDIYYKLMEIFSMRYLNKDIRKYKLLDVLLKILKLEIS
ncbi:MAG: hypothetical protein NTY74_14735 [Ignavibacteriae bacterium]|nr:hypothetical protein [Ignavibacteriota bacterium]